MECVHLALLRFLVFAKSQFAAVFWCGDSSNFASFTALGNGSTEETVSQALGSTIPCRLFRERVVPDLYLWRYYTAWIRICVLCLLDN